MSSDVHVLVNECNDELKYFRFREGGRVGPKTNFSIVILQYKHLQQEFLDVYLSRISLQQQVLRFLIDGNFGKFHKQEEPREEHMEEVEDLHHIS